MFIEQTGKGADTFSLIFREIIADISGYSRASVLRFLLPLTAEFLLSYVVLLYP
jgi:hypothetical protein